MTIPVAKKRFGQNFLIDEFIIDSIIHAIAPKPEDHLLEIGPGIGAITLSLLPLVKKLNAVELDKDLIPILENKARDIGNFIIHQQDILLFNLNEITSEPHSLRVVGNLPYNISTPLLFHLLDQKEFIIDMHFMLQQEVAHRLAASPGSKEYGRLTVMAQYHCDIEVVIAVPPHSFKPAPKVHSSFVRLIPKQPIVTANNIATLDRVVKEAFTKRRKTLSNALKAVLSTEQIANLDIDPRLRPEQISVENYVKMSNIIVTNSKEDLC